MEQEPQEKKSYEFAFLLSGDVFSVDLEKVFKQHNIDIKSGGQPRKIKLAYDIKKFSEVNFVFFHGEAFPADAKVLENDLQTLPFIVRFMIMRLPKRGRFPAVSREEYSARKQKVFVRKEFQPYSPPKRQEALSNEDLEKKIEEILQ